MTHVCVCVHASTQVTIRERIADDSTRVDPQRDGRPTAKKGAFGDCGRITYAHVYCVVFSYPPSICQTAVGAEYCPFIVSLYDAYKHQNQLRLVMEYMNGGSLQVHTYTSIQNLAYPRVFVATNAPSLTNKQTKPGPGREGRLQR